MQMSEDEKKRLAEHINRTKREFFTADDVKLFVDMLIGCELGGALKSVDRASISEKLKVYDELRGKQQSLLLNKTPGRKRTFNGKDDVYIITPEEMKRILDEYRRPLTFQEKQARDEFVARCREIYGECIAGRCTMAEYGELVRNGWRQFLKEEDF